MKVTLSSALSLALLAQDGAAFPYMMDKLTGPISELAKRQAIAPQGAGAMPITPPPFNAASQYVSNQGAHAFVAPGAGDDRGMCPGLNAMANHNYLPHNGRATIAQFTAACQTVFGMGPDLAAFLAIYGAVVDGTGTTWSIAGAQHTGIGGSHNNYESDSSPMYADLDQYGDMFKLVVPQFKEFYAMQPNASTANYNLEVLREYRGSRFQESISQNPDFAYLPLGGIVVSQAAFTFIYRFMANKSSEYPEGRLDQNTLKSFFAITGDDDNLKWTRGHEKIPNNWYKRNAADAYTIAYLNTDILYFAETQPEILTVGCNKGAVNTYSAIDPATLTGGAYTAAQIAASPFCFASQFLIAELPGLTGLSLSSVTGLLSQITSTLSGMNCPSIKSVNQTALTACPGFSLYGGPTAPVAPGAIQES